MNIIQVTEVTDELIQAIAHLMPQLTSHCSIPGRAELEEIVSSPMITFYIAFDPDDERKIIGTTTLVTFRTLTGVHAWIEDVVVDETARGKGLGKALTIRAMERAEELGAKSIDLTSRSSRVAANKLYQGLGFQLRETNLYKFPIRK